MQVNQVHNSNLPPADHPIAEPQAAAPASEFAGREPPVQATDGPAMAIRKAAVKAAGLKAPDAAGVRVSLSVDQESNRVIARVINKHSGEVVFQVPSEQLVRNATEIREMLGASFDAEA